MSILKVQKIHHTGSNLDVIDLADDGTCRANIINNLSNRNFIINGAMEIAARGATFNSVSHGQVITDRFKFEHGGAGTTDVYNITQKSNAAREIGFEHSLKVEVAAADSALASDHFAQIKYIIETNDIIKQTQYGLSNAKKLILSFYVKSSEVGTYPLAFNNGDGSRSNAYSYTINAQNTWERKTITINGDTGGNWQSQTGNGHGFGIRWGFAVGTGFIGTADGNWSATTNFGGLYGSYSNNFVSTQGATWELTGVQLEVDHTESGKPTDYEHLLLAQTIALCQRYYYRTADDGNTTNLIQTGVEGVSIATGGVPHPTRMRDIPTVTLGSGMRFWSPATSNITPTINANRSSSSNLALSINISGATAGSIGVLYRYQATGGYIEVDAEM